MCSRIVFPTLESTEIQRTEPLADSTDPPFTISRLNMDLKNKIIASYALLIAGIGALGLIGGHVKLHGAFRGLIGILNDNFGILDYRPHLCLQLDGLSPHLSVEPVR